MKLLKFSYALEIFLLTFPWIILTFFFWLVCIYMGKNIKCGKLMRQK